MRCRFPLLAFAWALAALLPCAEAGAATAAQQDFRLLGDRPGACKGVYGQPEPSGAGQGTGIDASADNAYLVEGGLSRLEGNVRVEYAGQTLTAGTVTVDQQAQTFAAEGGLLLRRPGLALAGAAARGDLATGEAELQAGSFLLHEARLRGQAARLDYLADGTLALSQGRFTTCEPHSRAWALRSSRIALHREQGYGTARHVRLSLARLPIAYFPYLRFPLDERRQSGFLAPAIGHGTDSGAEATLPYYLNLAPNHDLTYALRSLRRRGLGHEADFRHVSGRTRNRISAAYLGDDKAYRPRELQETEDSSGTPAAERADRWLLHLTHAGQYGRWASRINYSAVSDIDYLRDFGSPAAARGGFGQLGSRLHTPALLRTGALAYRRGNWQALAEMLGFQSLSQVHPEQYDTLPKLALRYRTPRASPLDFGLTLQGARFDRRTDDAAPPPVTGRRSVLDASLGLPWRRPWGRLVATADPIHREYALEGLAAGQDETPTVTTQRFTLDSALTLEKTISLFGREYQHRVEPRVFLLYTEETEQGSLPRFDSSSITPSYRQLFRANRFTGYDRIGDARQASVGLGTSLSRASGADLLTASIGQTFYGEDRQVHLLDAGEDASTDVSPLFLALAWKPARRLALRFAHEYDTQEDRLNRAHASLKYRPGRQRIFNLSWAYTRPELQRRGQLQNEREMKVSFIWPLSRRAVWHALGSWTHDRKEGRTLEALFGLQYNGCCTRARLVFRRFLKEPRLPAGLEPALAGSDDFRWRADSGLFLEVQLKGLGALGGRLDSLLEDSISGYRSP